MSPVTVIMFCLLCISWHYMSVVRLLSSYKMTGQHGTFVHLFLRVDHWASIAALTFLLSVLHLHSVTCKVLILSVWYHFCSVFTVPRHSVQIALRHPDLETLFLPLSVTLTVATCNKLIILDTSAASNKECIWQLWFTLLALISKIALINPPNKHQMADRQC